MATKSNTAFKTKLDICSGVNQVENEVPERGALIYCDENVLVGTGSEFKTLGGSASVNSQGFIDYNDTTGRINITANTWTAIPNNGQGAFSNDTYRPQGVTEFMDVSTGAIDVSELALGDSILIRNDFKVNPNTNNALLEFRYTLGGGGNEYVLETIKGRLDNGSGQDYRFNLGTDLIYMGDTNTKDNPILLQVRLSTNGTLLNAGSVIQLIKRNV
ncbi:MAG: hypothetical protein HRU18_28735 [Pseudoalteromonas sp.]|uniref:hypothetical protein n=1 Tax=Pseudoalteromonas sp. TaxID=53249 RepID=UPI001E15C5CF|nr:hypothetical protein [Pseudoalteromonas sp.]NRA82198.1 hypothetical protein [Pseudoalteromonas sp.]